MKTDEELLALKQEYETLNNKLAELTAGELIKVTGGTVERIGSVQRPQGYERALYGVNYEYAIFSPLSRSKLHVSSASLLFSVSYSCFSASNSSSVFTVVHTS